MSSKDIACAERPKNVTFNVRSEKLKSSHVVRSIRTSQSALIEYEGGELGYGRGSVRSTSPIPADNPIIKRGEQLGARFRRSADPGLEPPKPFL